MSNLKVKSFDEWVLEANLGTTDWSKLKSGYFKYLGSSKDFSVIESYRCEDIQVGWVKMWPNWTALCVETWAGERYGWTDTYYCVHNGVFGFARMSENGIVMKEFTEI